MRTPGTLLPDVHFLEQLWQEPIYYCKKEKKEILRGSGATENFSASYNSKLALAKAAPKSAHTHRGWEQGAGFWGTPKLYPGPMIQSRPALAELIEIIAL